MNAPVHTNGRRKKGKKKKKKFNLCCRTQAHVNEMSLGNSEHEATPWVDVVGGNVVPAAVLNV